jgi:hypothetical protein
MAMIWLLMSSSMMLSVKDAAKIKRTATTVSPMSAKHEFDFDGGAADTGKGVIEGGRK